MCALDTVFVLNFIGCIILLRRENQLLYSLFCIILPLLFWVQPLDANGYSEVKFGVPDLFMRCSVEGKSQDESCLYKVSEITGSKLTYGTVVWKIPSGMKVHAGIVSIFTFVAALVSAILIAATSIFYSDINSSKHLKES